MSMIISALPFSQGRVQMYLAAVPSRFLERFSIDTWNPKNVMGQRGYQRNPDEARIKSIAKYFERRNAIMPVAGLLNIRERGKIKYKNGNLVIPDGTDVWVVDMQHRLKGLVRAIDEGSVEGERFTFPVVITEGLAKVDEAAQFYVINTKAKKMDVALTRRLLIENNRIKDIADVRPWEIPAVQITIALNTNPHSPWHERLRQPNEERAKHHIATEKSFVSSLRQLLITRRFGGNKKVAKRLITMWSVIKEALPDAFVEPRRYLLQKTPGMFAFNFFLAPTLFAKNASDQDLRRRLLGLRKLGPTFWNRANKRGARRFGSGMAGYANLAEFIRKFL